MGKYLPIIVTAECGSLTRAGQILGYAQPNLGHIVTRFENELGVKLFIRDQRGVRLTQVGEELLEVMGQVEALEERMQEIAAGSRRTALRVGVFRSVAVQWMPEVIEAFRREYPETLLEMKELTGCLEGELGLKNGALDCAFSCSEAPAGLQSVPLLEDACYLAVSKRSPLAGRGEVSAREAAGQYPFLAGEIGCELEGAAREIYENFARGSVVKNPFRDITVTAALVERDVGVSIVSGLDLCDIPAGAGIEALPFTERVSRSIHLLYPKEGEQSPRLLAFVRLVRRQVELWKQQHPF